jgi:prolyl-tRNA synthetase
MIGGMVMVHGDDGGLRVPPLLAPVQALVCVVKDGDGVHEAAHRLADRLRAAGVRVAVDARTDTPFGRRAVDAELKGFPLRIELGPRDLGEGQVVLVRRLDGSKTPTPIDAVPDRVTATLAQDQRALHDAAREHRDARTVEVKTLDEAVEAAATGWARLPWASVGVEGETRLNAQGLTVRCLVREDGGVPDSEDEAGLVALVARAY